MPHVGGNADSENQATIGPAKHNPQSSLGVVLRC